MRSLLGPSGALPLPMPHSCPPPSSFTNLTPHYPALGPLPHPRYAKAHYRAALALEALGRPADAAAAAARAAERDPGSRDAATLARRLAALAVGLPRGLDGATGAAAAAAAGGAALQAAAAAGARAAAAGAATEQPGVWQPMTEARVLGLLPADMAPGSAFVAPPDGLDANVLVLLHGTGDTPRGFAGGGVGQTPPETQQPCKRPAPACSEQPHFSRVTPHNHPWPWSPGLARHMALPQTAALALAGPLPVAETNGGRAWFRTFEDDGWTPIAPAPGEARRARSLSDTVGCLLPMLAALAGAAAPAGGGGGGGGGSPLRRVHLLGFSDGGTVVLEAAHRLLLGGGGGGSGGGSDGGASGARLPPWLGSVASIAGSLLEESLPELERAGGGGGGGKDGGSGSGGKGVSDGRDISGSGLRRLPVLITHGDTDDVVPRSAVERCAAQRRRRAGQWQGLCMQAAACGARRTSPAPRHAPRCTPVPPPAAPGPLRCCGRRAPTRRSTPSPARATKWWAQIRARPPPSCATLRAPSPRRRPAGGARAALSRCPRARGRRRRARPRRRGDPRRRRM
jgi:predicted esterase